MSILIALMFPVVMFCVSVSWWEGRYKTPLNEIQPYKERASKELTDA